MGYFGLGGIGRWWSGQAPKTVEEKKEFAEEFGMDYDNWSLRPEDVPVKFRGGILGPRARKNTAQKAKPLWETGGVRKRRTSRRKF
jgi:hypothetical protein